jgi:hypothetical protein
MGAALRPSVQAAHVGVEDAEEGVLRLRGGGRRAVLEVDGVDLALLGPREREAALAGFAGCLNALAFPVQLLVRVVPADLEATRRALERRLRREPAPALAALGRDHAAFLGGLGVGGALLERRCYLVVPAPEVYPAATAPEGGRSPRLPFRLAWPGRRPPAGPPASQSDPGPDDRGPDPEAALAARCDELARQLGRCGLVASRLDGPGLADLLAAWWRPAHGRRGRAVSSEAADWPAGGRRPPAALDPGALADRVAPAAVELARDHLRLDDAYARVLLVTAFPRTVDLGWLAPLLECGLPLELSLHIAPLPTAALVRDLGRRLARLESSRALAERRGRLADPEAEVACGDVARLRDALQRGEARAFATGVYLLLRAPTLAALDEATRRAEAVLDGLLAQSRVALFEQAPGLRSCAPVGQDALRVGRTLDTESLAAAFPFGAVGPGGSGGPGSERGVFYGVARPVPRPVVLDPFDPGLENANLVVMATPGAGKSYFTKLLALRSLLAGVDVLIVDPEGEYGGLCAAAGGQRVRLAAASDQRINPFDLPPPTAEDGGEDDGDGALAAQVAALAGLVEVLVATPAVPLAPNERALLDRALYRAYAGAGITADPATHRSPVPLMADLHAVLAAEGGATAPGLAARLHRYVHGSLAGLFAGPTNVALDRRLVVFDVRALDPALRPAAAHLVAGLVWGLARRALRPRLLVVDEAWSLLQYPEGGAFLTGLARRARKHYLGLVTVSQDVTDFLRSPHGPTVLRTAATKLLLKQDATAVDDVEAVFGLSAGERRFLLGAAKGEGLLCARGVRLPLRVLASPAEHALATTAPAEVAARRAARAAGAGGAGPEADRPPGGGCLVYRIAADGRWGESGGRRGPGADGRARPADGGGDGRGQDREPVLGA